MKYFNFPAIFADLVLDVSYKTLVLLNLSLDSNTLYFKQTLVASEPPLTVDAPGSEAEATPPATCTAQVEAVPPARGLLN